MRLFPVCCASLFAVLVACGPSPVSKVDTEEVFERTPLGIEGIGAIKIGMSRKQAEEASGEPIVLKTGEQNVDPQGCRYGALDKGPDGLSFMLTGETIARIDVQDNAAIKTTEGAHIGSTEDEVKALYNGRIQSSPHKYSEGWHVLSVADADAETKFQYVFETDGRIVRSFRAGRLPEVTQVERCG